MNISKVGVWMRLNGIVVSWLSYKQLQTASHIHIICVQSVLAPWYAVDGHMGTPLHCYTCVSGGGFLESWGVGESEWYFGVIVEATNSFRLYPTSIQEDVTDSIIYFLAIQSSDKARGVLSNHPIQWQCPRGARVTCVLWNKCCFAKMLNHWYIMPNNGGNFRETQKIPLVSVVILRWNPCGLPITKFASTSCLSQTCIS